MPSTTPKAIADGAFTYHEDERAEEPVGNEHTVNDAAWVEDRYLVKQKLFSLNEVYTLLNEAEEPQLFVRRRSRRVANLLALFGGLLTFVVVLVPLMFLVASLGLPQVEANVGLVLGGIVLSFIPAGAVLIWLTPYRHVSFCTDRAFTDMAMSVTQDNRAHPWIRWFTLHEGGEQGPVLARFRKNAMWDMIRRRWHIYGADGQLIGLAMEDSLMKAILRRVVKRVLPLLPIRTNFIITDDSGRRIVAEFNRKFTIRDHYVLHFHDSTQRLLDRRVALAGAVLLDTGERR